MSSAIEWKPHVLRLGTTVREEEAAPEPSEVRADVEAWLGAVIQSEHLSLLLGNGLTSGIAYSAKAKPATLAAIDFDCDLKDEVNAAATEVAKRLGRDEANIEDQLRAALQLIGGLQILEDGRAGTWRDTVDGALTSLAESVLDAERGIVEAVSTATEDGLRAAEVLVSFLLSFASRTGSRERLHIFTTNYDRLMEFGCDLAGLRPLDRFVGALEPVFRASRLDIDLHYNPPGIRGEPRYLEGVARMTKLHGSLDWRFGDGTLRRVGLPFGARAGHPAIASGAYDSMIIYPNPAKEIETVDFPYAELFRDFSAALCRPNSALITYGYGFGDDHINRVIRDMLTIPSTHMLVVSYDDCDGRLPTVIDRLGRSEQISLMVGDHFGSVEQLVDEYLPKPATEGFGARARERLTATAAATGSGTTT
jgi:hypothetical protein